MHTGFYVTVAVHITIFFLFLSFPHNSKYQYHEKNVPLNGNAYSCKFLFCTTYGYH